MREIYDALKEVDALVDALVDAIRAEGVLTWPLYWAMIDARRRLWWAQKRYNNRGSAVASRAS